MPHSAYYIVEEFLRSRDPQTRKNALTALAVLDRDEGTIERLAKLAIIDADDGVRHRAVEEIGSLPNEVFPRAVRALQDVMADRSRRQTAYALLGHLKSLGRSLPRPGSFLSLPARLRLAWSMNKHTYPIRKWRFRLRTWKPAFLGGLIGLLIVWFSFSKAINWQNKAYPVIVFLIPMLTILVCAFATRHAAPFNVYFDRPAAFTVEIGGAILYNIATEMLLLFLVLVYHKDPDGSEGLLALVVGLPFIIGVTRAATLVSYGVLRWRWLNIVFQTTVSVASVFLTIVMVNLVFWKIKPVVGEQKVSHFELKMLYQMMESFWLALLPVGVALAMSFAMIDNKSPLKLTRAGRLSKYYSYGVILLSAVLLMIILIVGRPEKAPKGVNLNPTLDRLSGRVSSETKPADGSSDAPEPSP